MFADADGFGQVAERVFGFDVAFAFADQNAERWAVGFGADLAVDRGDVEVHLARELGLELDDLQIDHDVAVQLQVIEQQVDAVVVAVDVDLVLPAGEGEA